MSQKQERAKRIVLAAIGLATLHCLGNDFFYCNDFVRVIAKIGTWACVIFVLVRYRRMYTKFKHVPTPQALG